MREASDDKTAKRVSNGVEEAVLDKGYHSNETLLALFAALTALWQWQRLHLDRLGRIGDGFAPNSLARRARINAAASGRNAAFTTGC